MLRHLGYRRVLVLLVAIGVAGCTSSATRDEGQQVTVNASLDQAAAAVERAFQANGVRMDDEANRFMSNAGLGPAAGAKVYVGDVPEGPRVTASIARGGDRGTSAVVAVHADRPADAELEAAILDDVRAELGGER